ncbi:MAG: hypothetical protein ACI81P_000362 [Neolewinella sp.]|jgi:hypothetical protein
MKPLLILLVFLTAGSFSLCGQVAGGNVKYVGSSTQGVITVIADGFGKKKPEAFDNAVRTTFRQLLTRGIAGSFQYKPLLGNKPTEVMVKRKAFFDAFFADKAYNSFLIDQGAGKFSRKTKKKIPNLTVRLDINVSSFRAYLEEQGLVRKFGF